MSPSPTDRDVDSGSLHRVRRKTVDLRRCDSLRRRGPLAIACAQTARCRESLAERGLADAATAVSPLMDELTSLSFRSPRKNLAFAGVDGRTVELDEHHFLFGES